MVNFTKTKEYLICVDSDGTVMDSMLIKHERALGPKVISVFGMEEHEEEILKKWCDVNLYKETRGLNRFIALDSILEFAKSFGYQYDGYDAFHEWVLTTDSLSIDSLQKEIDKKGNKECLCKALEWGLEVNDEIKKLPLSKPFINAKKSIEILSCVADLLGVSSANYDAITTEWHHAQIDTYFKAIACQKDGTKECIIADALSLGYDPKKVLMLGDSVGDLIAAKKNNIHFFPFIPKHENDSWNELIDKSLPLFLDNKFDDDYQKDLIDRFKSVLS